MVINLVAVDPRDDTRILQYRVPENSRELELLIELFDANCIEHTILTYSRKKKKTADSPPS